VQVDSRASDLLQLADVFVGAVLRSARVPRPPLRSDGAPKNKKDQVRFAIEDAFDFRRRTLHLDGCSGGLTVQVHPGF